MESERVQLFSVLTQSGRVFHAVYLRLETMDLTQVPQFVATHFEMVAGVICLIIFFLGGVYLYTETRSSGAPAHVAASTDLKAIEGTLKRILEEGGRPAQAPPASAAPPSIEAQAAQAQLVAELTEKAQQDVERVRQEMQAQFAEKQKELEGMRAKLSMSAVSGASDETSGEAEALRHQIDELEARLREYEIIEDDIADLSIFKEENARLKTELEQIKSGAVASASPLSASAQAPGALTEELTEEAFASEPVASVGASVAASAEQPASDDLADLEALVDQEALAKEAALAELEAALAGSPAEISPEEMADESILAADSLLNDESFEEALLEAKERPLQQATQQTAAQLDAEDFNAALENSFGSDPFGTKNSTAERSAPVDHAAISAALENSLSAANGAPQNQVGLENEEAPTDEENLDFLMAEFGMNNSGAVEVNTEQLIAEVGSLEASAAGTEDVLDDSLDTERLLAEANAIPVKKTS